MTLRDLVKQLPDFLRPWANIYVDLLSREAPEQVESFVKIALGEGWAAAHRMMLTRMTTAEIVAEQQAANSAKAEMNESQAALLASQKQIIIDLLLLAIKTIIGQ
jgi:hypothetical protein